MIPRPVAALALAALLLGGAGVAAAITHDDGGGEAARTAVTTTSSVVVDTTTTTLDPTTTTAAGVTTTMARDNASTTTSRPARTTTTRAATTTSTTAAASECTRAQIEVNATTDKSSYGPGQQVKVDSTLRNRSRTTCVYAGHTFQVAIQDAAGRTIITFELIAPGPTGTPFVPGATLTGSVPWDQRTCQTQPCPQPPPGAYSAAVKWTFAGGPYEARAAFTLVP